MSDIEPRIPVTELEVVQAGQWRVPVSLGGVTGGCPQRTFEPPFLVLGPAVLSALLLGSTVCVHMALKGMGSRGPQRWVLPCGMQRGRCCSLLLASLDTGPSPVVLMLLPVAMT